MYNITICIPTYKRPEMLKKLVLSIVENNINKTLIKEVNIIVADNDVEKTAESLINELKEKFNNLYKIDYFNHPAKGISNVRNELIKKAFLQENDFIVFIDDDEYVTTEWLNELVKTISSNDADAARGPVLAKIDETIPDDVSCWFKRESYPDNSQLNFLSTGNLIIKRTSLQKFNVWFDTRFNITGNEDTYFGIQFLKKGAKIFWAANAIVYETIPESRANIKWLIKRVYRGASGFTYMLKLEKEYLKLIKRIPVSLIYSISGICALILLMLPIKKKYWGILTLAKGIGELTGFVNLQYKEYK